MIGAAQALAQNLNGMTAGIQQLRSQAEAGISGDVQTANTALQQIANINLQLESAQPDAATATLEDQRDQDVAQLSQLMNVRVQKNANNQYSLFTSTGQQLVSGTQASQLSFNNVGTLSATSLWSANPSQDGAGTITLTSPSGSQSDLIASGAIQSGEIGAYLQMRDTILPQAQNQLDELANQMSQALSNQTTAGTPAVSGSQTGFSVDVGSLSAGNSVQLTYTDPGNVQHTITLVALGAGGSLPLQTSPSNPNNQIIGVNFAGGMAAVVTQLNAAFGTNLQFSNPSGTVLQAVNASATTNVVNALSATSTVTSLTSGSPQLPLFLDGTTPITGALTSAGSQTTGLAGRIAVNARARRRAGKPRRLRGRHRRGRSDAAELLAQPTDRRHADLCADHRHRQRATAVQRHARRLHERDHEPAKPGGERGDQFAAGPGHRGQRLAAALQQHVRRQHRH